MDDTLKASIDEVHSHIAKLARGIINLLIAENRIEGSQSKELLLYANQLLKLLPENSEPKWLNLLLGFEGERLSSRQNPNSAPQFAAFLQRNIAVSYTHLTLPTILLV